MVRSVLVGALLIATGAAAAGFVIRWHSADMPAGSVQQSATPQLATVRDSSVAGARVEADRSPAELERRVRVLEERVAAEAAERQRLAERCEAVAAQLAAPAGDSNEIESGHRMADGRVASAEAQADETASATAADSGTSAMERALAAAGLDPSTAAEIKRRRDELTMSEMYLRDQATREQWLDSPRFSEEMAAIEAQRTSIRDEIGDDSYDRYLYALGEPNRVRIDDVMSESPAAEAGLQVGDMIVRYADSRIFAPGELVAQTRGGTAGESVRLEVIRNGERLEMDVPRGPLGLRIATTQAEPDAS